MKVDVLVAGGGPAGLAAGIAAARAGCSVAIVDPHEGVIDKACGEGLMPGGVAMLRALGVGEVPGVPFVGIRYEHAEDPSLVATGSFPGEPGRGIRRTTLHEALRDRASALGVRFVRGRVEAPESGAGGVHAGEHSARWLVAADGLHSPIRRALGLEAAASARAPKRYGIRRHFRVAPWSDRVEVTFGCRAEAYVTPVAGGLVGVAFLFEKKRDGAPKRFEELLAGFPRLASRLEGHEPATAPRGAGPFLQHTGARRAGNVLLVGDAAGYIDPLTGEGVALGMATGVLAVQCLLEGDVESYERRYARLTRNYRVLTSSLLAVARRPWLHRPLLTIARALPSVFDATLARIGKVSDELPLSLGEPRPSGERPLLTIAIAP